MKQRTLDIIYICKGYTKYRDGAKDHLDAVKNYIADVYLLDPKHITDHNIYEIMYDAMKDYFDSCDKPSEFIEQVVGMMYNHKSTLQLAIANALRHCTVKKNGKYINGFDDRIYKLKEMV